MAEDFAPTIRALRTGAPGVSGQQAVARQRAGFLALASEWNCVVEGLEEEPRDRPGLLQGVALAHKDVFDLPHRPAGAGGHASRSPGARAQARVLAKLQAAGASHLGALTLSELCCGATGENRHFGRPVNPCDARAVVGGSSSGSAVAVAAGLCAASLGTDTAGSVRIPAATCGIVGLKPTHQAIDSAGVFRLAPSLDTVGLLARSASDAAHVWTALTAPDASPPRAELSDGIEKFLAHRQRWRLMLCVETDGLDPVVAAVLEPVLQALKRHWRTVAGLLPQREHLSALAQVVLHVEAAAQHLGRLKGGGSDDLPRAAEAILLPGLSIPATWYARAIGAREQARDDFLRSLLTGADMVITPALARPVPHWSQVTAGSPDYDLRELLALHADFAYVNYLGLPAVVFPVGRDPRGRPVSLQAIGRAGAEPTLLAFAHQVMRALSQAAPSPLPQRIP